MNYILEKTCCFSGHREMDETYSESLLEENIMLLIDRGFDTFLVGMALGFDTECFHVLERLRKKYKIKIVACIPCSEQADKFSDKKKEEYFKMLKSADEQELVSTNYHIGCMQKRNRFMVERSSVLIAYLRKKTGGTKSTVDYAKKNNKEIIMI